MSHQQHRQFQRSQQCPDCTGPADARPASDARERTELSFQQHSYPADRPSLPLWTCLLSIEAHDRLGPEELERRVRAVQRLEPFDLRLTGGQELVARIVMEAEDSADACQAAMRLAEEMGVHPEGVAAYRFSDDHLDMRFAEGEPGAADATPPHNPADDPWQVPGENPADLSGFVVSDRRKVGDDPARMEDPTAEWPSRLLAASTTRDEPVLCLVMVDGDPSLYSPAEQQRRREVMGRLCLGAPRLTEEDYLQGRLCVAASNPRQACERAQMLFAVHHIDLEAIYASGCTEHSFDFCSEED